MSANLESSRLQGTNGLNHVPAMYADTDLLRVKSRQPATNAMRRNYLQVDVVESSITVGASCRAIRPNDFDQNVADVEGAQISAKDKDSI